MVAMVPVVWSPCNRINILPFFFQVFRIHLATKPLAETLKNILSAITTTHNIIT